jgi:hypothetical protein
MGMGIIGESVLGDIANAIREQNGGSATYKPADMAAAVTALDGTKSGDAATLTLKSGSGVVSDSVFSDIAAAIRGQNGLSTKYKPGEMAQAIRDLTWDVGFKPRAILYNRGRSIELNYLDGPQLSSGEGEILASWEVSTDGYASDSDLPWHDVREQIIFVGVDSSFSEVTFTDISHWFQGMTALMNVTGFDNISGVAKANQTFSGDSELRSIWCDAAYAPSISAASIPFYGCRKLVGGHLTVAKDTMGKSAFTTGTNGLLVCNTDDQRSWAFAYLYSDGSLVVNRYGVIDASRTVTASGTLCTNARYNGLGSMPWHELRDTITSVTFASDMSGVSGLSMDYWFYNTKSSAIAFDGWSNVHPVSIEYLFNGSVNLQTLDLRGLDPSTILRWNYAFSGMSSLTMILASSSWTLPTAFTTKSNTFYADSKLVGGNGTVFSSSKTSADYAVIDNESHAGYLTAG